ncbi:hypothetical protein PN497_00850 [Sphaerospermopsis kisseleviana CS-549]|jgi:hypothetical protein|uniref:Uncharacterized protein n=3 Tax=Sphaerospermopsis TaxID=752201 RepID=A0ABR9VHF0_9CYAN|nr:MULTISPECIES: hypothetical protein [Sphaerospermopsis]MBD2144586.1 hypothetical protein [Sphaerospermopsis sp. FACHB-1194]MBE9237922.1 hypothetical protein [Sphaerospermopsis aphanizomenoides LEGE 00250]MDB9439935.1 hypothetical protein [Sphaerospermopsis kisseleviana CS-549]BAZ80893.1 hypothetical protein NIES73_21590 [Sphaerospermopsis kisseleviana NIES-73]
MSETINFQRELTKGLLWGFALGINLDITIAILHDSDILFSTYVVISILSAILGGITALVILGIIGTLKGINWFLILFFGSLITFLTTVLNIVWATIAGWVSLIVVPILYLVRKTLAEKAPKWLEKSVDISMELFLTSLILTGLVSIFEKVTGISLIRIWEFL